MNGSIAGHILLISGDLLPLPSCAALLSPTEKLKYTSRYEHSALKIQSLLYFITSPSKPTRLLNENIQQ